MATIKQIVLKSVELKDAAELLDKFMEDRDKAQARLDAANAEIALQQPVVQALKLELQALINEP